MEPLGRLSFTIVSNQFISIFICIVFVHAPRSDVEGSSSNQGTADCCAPLTFIYFNADSCKAQHNRISKKKFLLLSRVGIEREKRAAERHVIYDPPPPPPPQPPPPPLPHLPIIRNKKQTNNNPKSGNSNMIPHLHSIRSSDAPLFKSLFFFWNRQKVF